MAIAIATVRVPIIHVAATTIVCIHVLFGSQDNTASDVLTQSLRRLHIGARVLLGLQLGILIGAAYEAALLAEMTFWPRRGCAPESQQHMLGLPRPGNQSGAISRWPRSRFRHPGRASLIRYSL